MKAEYNKKNMGTFYTRSVGALSAKGKYIFPMDGDDMFMDKDVFSTITNIADKGNFDLIPFYSINSRLNNAYSTNFRIENGKKERIANLVLFQPLMGNYSLRPDNNTSSKMYMIEVQCFARCVRTNIYKKSLHKLGEERYSRYMLLDEDVIINYCLFNTARSMKYIPKVGYLYMDRPGSVSRVLFDKLKLLSYRIYFLDCIIVFAQDFFEHKKILVNLALYCLENNLLKDVLTKSEYDYNLLISCLDRILNCKYISDEDKNEIRKKGKSLDFIKYNF